MKTFLLPAATLILYILFSCKGDGRNRKDLIEGKWNVDSISFKGDTSFKSILFKVFVQNDSTIPDLEFKNDTFFVFMGVETDTLQYVYHHNTKMLIINEQEEQPYHVAVGNDKTLTLVTNDNDVIYLKKL